MTAPEPAPSSASPFASAPAVALLREFETRLAEGDFAAARALVEAAAQDPHTALAARYGRGVLAMHGQPDLDRCEQDFRACVEADPAFASAHHNLGVIAQWRQDYAGAAAHLRRALELAPGGADTAVALSNALFVTGDYARGWPLFEHRTGGLASPHRQRGLWDGTPIPHGALAVMGEQGLGDVLQFVRYVPAIRPRVGRLYLVMDGQFASLASLLASVPGVDAIVTDRRAGPPIHAFVPIMTLAHIAGASLQNVGTCPYLHPPPERVAAWRERLAEADAGRPRRPRVGLVWGGNPREGVTRASDIDARRSIAPERLLPLAEVPEIEWHSLQLGAAARSPGRIVQALSLHDHTAHIRDFSDTAAYVAQLDLVVTVDTSAAHLAGAIGAPVWMLNRYDSCWRWGGNAAGNRTPWYPTMRIFRQPSLGDWDSVVGELVVALREWAADRPVAG